MAKLIIFNVVLALLIVVAPMVLAEVELSPSAEPGLYSYVEQCVAVTGARCGEEILYGSFMGKPVTLECCQKLLLMGKACDDALMRVVLEFPEYKGHEEEALAGSNKLWEKCALAVQAASPSPSD
ncbi:hypothetical protein POPTR_009G104800v4 [Populus trichocarpa]|jgi:hypothetical protein|uniref:Prolamin-like domain-containing protein n=1 Tax=Populus trichocarpa TaxID=3694 RepID=B9HRY2_POPTR|nr:uncharacterized protein LOC7490016 [Populus trichocarpa]KAI5577106.1 hypothetical protein BDE02_09G091900 [Populus trichocarpa]PNT20654.1 hypothetical protein POPTR_009G104800v4 [Populus trichocarpa]|eukprot:XP_002313100.1 uncharacterized protein LOC7490016 [Populus trichocarpa]